MAEVTIEPTPLVWKGRAEDLDPDRTMWGPVGWAYFARHDGLWRDVNPDLDRDPIIVLCPMQRSDGELIGTPFIIDSYSSVSHQLWQVTVDISTLEIGKQPFITVSPSIHLVGVWHGWLDQGVLHN